MIALTFGFGIPGSIVFGKEMMNTSIRDKKDLEGLSVPLLGVITLASRKERKTGPLLVREKCNDALNESFRILRTNLDILCMRNNWKVIQFTSMEPGSGKTFVAVNLAMSFALAGKKVVLLDLDLRTAALSKLIDYPDLGMSNMLNKSVMDEQFFVEKNYFYSGFDIIPAGPVPLNPSELLMSKDLKILMEKLRVMYDYVFIDGTPAGIVADTSIIGQFADLSVFVLRENYTNRRMLPELENIYHNGNFKNTHIIMNGSISGVPMGAYYNKNLKSIFTPRIDAYRTFSKRAAI
jgi:capsular exopolysaccharide synthesis family protein